VLIQRVMSHEPTPTIPVDCPDCEDRGWLHMMSLTYGPELQRCDSCRRYASDDDAAEAHASACGCHWNELEEEACLL
jgi:hypothetical protein